MSLRMVQVEPDKILLVGRFRSDTVLLYLHTTSNSFTEGLSVKIFQHGTYTFIPPSHAGN